MGRLANRTVAARIGAALTVPDKIGIRMIGTYSLLGLFLYA
jgi:hypothetical protein